MTEHNLPENDDAPWLNLTPQEVEELRYNKQELTEYGREKIREKIIAIGKEYMIRYDEALRKLGND